MLYLTPASRFRRTTPPHPASVITPHTAALPKCAAPTSPTARLTEIAVAAANWIRYTKLAYFSRPRGNRQLFRLVKRHKICRIVEIGISNLARAESLIQVAQRFAGDQKVWYTGLDMFEARAHGRQPLALKETYRILRATDANVRLVPGVPRMSLASAANAHQNTDLIVVGPDVSENDLHGAWFYVPRMLHANSLILSERHEADGQISFHNITRTQIAEWAGRDSVWRAA